MHSFADLMFTESVRAEQQSRGSGPQYALPYRVLEIGPDERQFIETRSSFYMATVNTQGWPYVQHRGGPPGFLKVLGRDALAFADYPGNRQFVSTGNLAGDDRVSLFLIDYTRRARLKILARASVTPVADDPDLAAGLIAPDGITPSHIFRLQVEAVDWNCPKYITPRFSEDEIEALLGPKLRAMSARIAELEAELAGKS